MELTSILYAFKAYGFPGLVIGILITFGGRWIFTKQQERKEKENSRWTQVNLTQQQLMSQIHQNHTGAIELVREERKTYQDNWAKFFDILDRNTRSVEKLVEKMDEHSREQSSMREQLARIEGKA